MLHKLFLVIKFILRFTFAYVSMLINQQFLIFLFLKKKNRDPLEMQNNLGDLEPFGYYLLFPRCITKNFSLRLCPFILLTLYIPDT